MKRRLRHAEADMRCLAAYWNEGWEGPSPHPKGSSYLKQLMGLKSSPPPPVDEERARQVFFRWVEVLKRDTKMANALVYRYRDGKPQPDKLVNQALDMLSRM